MFVSNGHVLSRTTKLQTLRHESRRVIPRILAGLLWKLRLIQHMKWPLITNHGPQYGGQIICREPCLFEEGLALKLERSSSVASNELGQLVFEQAR